MFQGHLLPSAWGRGQWLLQTYGNWTNRQTLSGFFQATKNSRNMGRNGDLHEVPSGCKAESFWYKSNFCAKRSKYIRNLIAYSCILLQTLTKCLVKWQSLHQLATKRRSNTQVYPSMETTYWNDITTVSHRTTCPTLPPLSWASIQPNKSRRKLSQDNPSSTRPVPQVVKEPLGGRCC